MRGLFVILLLTLCSSSGCMAQSIESQLVPQSLVPKNYHSADGALLLTTNGNYVEPYFAVKALLTAQDAGLHIRDAGLAWSVWPLQRQDKDGRCNHYGQRQREWRHTGRAE